MARGNFNSQTKRLRELAKKDKRAAKDEKRAQKKADARAARATAGTMRPTAASAPPAKDELDVAGAIGNTLDAGEARTARVR